MYTEMEATLRGTVLVTLADTVAAHQLWGFKSWCRVFTLNMTLLYGCYRGYTEDIQRYKYYT